MSAKATTTMRASVLPVGSEIDRDGVTATKRFTADPQWYAPGTGWFNDAQANTWLRTASHVRVTGRQDVSVPVAMCHVRGGDVITLPGETGQRTVDSAWWISDESSHGLRFADGEERIYESADAPDVTLHQRPGFGPFDAVYAVGDRVTSYFNRRVDVGVVTDVFRYGDEVGYEVHRVIGGAGACVGPENMRREITPEVGQQWVMPANGHTLTVTGFADDWPHRLVVQGKRPGQRVALGGPEWALIVSGPHRVSPSVRRCDVGGEQLDGAWWLLRSVARGWEADHGASCATHAGQREPYPGTQFQPCPTGYAAAVEAQMERAGLRVDPAERLGDEVPAVDMPAAPTAAALADAIAANQPPPRPEPRMVQIEPQPATFANNPYVSDWATALLGN